MATMNISLPDEMKAWVEEQATSGAYANSSDVVRDSIRRAIERESAIASLNAEIEKGFQSPLIENYDPEARRKTLKSRFNEHQRESVNG